MKVNMNKFTIINVMFTFKIFVPPILIPSQSSLLQVMQWLTWSKWIYFLSFSTWSFTWLNRRCKLYFNKCSSLNLFFINCRPRRSSSVTFPTTLTNLKSHMRTTTCRSAQASANCVSTWTSSWPFSCLKRAVALNVTCNGTVVYPISTSIFSDIAVKRYVFPVASSGTCLPEARARCMTVRPILPIVKRALAAAVFLILHVWWISQRVCKRKHVFELVTTANVLMLCKHCLLYITYI